MANEQVDKKDTKQMNDLQQKYMQFQMFDQQMKQCRQQLEAVQSQMAEVQAVLLALDDVSKSKIGAEILAPLSAGIFVRAELKDNRLLNVNVGSGTIVEKSVQDTKALLERQILDLAKLNEDLLGQFTSTAGEAERLQAELQESSPE